MPIFYCYADVNATVDAEVIVTGSRQSNDTLVAFGAYYIKRKSSQHQW